MITYNDLHQVKYGGGG